MISLGKTLPSKCNFLHLSQRARPSEARQSAFALGDAPKKRSSKLCSLYLLGLQIIHHTKGAPDEA